MATNRTGLNNPHNVAMSIEVLASEYTEGEDIEIVREIVDLSLLLLKLHKEASGDEVFDFWSKS